METRPVILANQQRLLREMLRHVIEKAPDFHVVGEVADVRRLPKLLDQTQAQWVVVSLESDGELPSFVGPLLALHPALRVLAVAIDGSEVRTKWVEVREKGWRDVSLEGLIATLRSEGSEGPRMLSGV